MFQKPKKSIGAPHSSSSVHPLSTAAISAGSFNEAVLAAKKRVLLDKVKNPYFSSEQDHYRAIAEAIPHIVFTADPDGEVDYYNEQWHRYTSLSWEETLQQGDDSILHPDDRQRCQEKWDNAVKTGELYEIEYRLRRITRVEYFGLTKLLFAFAMRDFFAIS
jgi:PAS domain S-box-containing protein